MRPFLPLLLALLAACGDKETEDTGSEEVVDAGAFATTQLTDGGTWSVTYVPLPDPIPAAADFAIDLTVAEAAAPEVALTDIESIVVDGTMPTHGHGMTVTPISETDGSGTWTAYPLKFHMTGEWSITAEITRGGVTETATFLVDCCEVGG